MTTSFKGKAVKISMAKLEDVNNLVSLEYDLFKDNANDRLFFQKATKGGNTHCIITKSGKELVGYLVYQNKDGIVELLSLGVADTFQRQGIATGMLNVLIDVDKYDEINCVVGEYNLPSQMLLKGLGFKCWKTLSGYYSESPQNDAYFFKRLKLF